MESKAEGNSPVFTPEQYEYLKSRIELELETLESIYVDEGVVQQQPKVTKVVKSRPKDEQAQEE